LKGGYILSDAPGGKPDVILMGTGSELSLAVAAQDELAKSGIKARVVSLPCFELFDEQPQSYQEEVLPPAVTARVAVEAGVRQGWDRYLAGRGAFVGMNGFGMSAPFEEIYKAVGITSEKVAAEAKRLLGK
jgi:transketolase